MKGSKSKRDRELGRRTPRRDARCVATGKTTLFGEVAPVKALLRVSRAPGILRAHESRASVRRIDALLAAETHAGMCRHARHHGRNDGPGCWRHDERVVAVAGEAAAHAAEPIFAAS